MKREFTIDFSKEKRTTYLTGFGIVFFLLVVLNYPTNQWMVSIIISTIITIVFFLKAYYWNKYFVRSFEISEQIVTIEYYMNENLKSIECKLDDLKVHKKLAIVSAGRQPILIINNGNGLKIYQYAIGDWTEEVMDQIIADIQVNQHS